MDGKAKQNNDLSLPQELEQQFALLQKRLWRVDTSVLLAGIIFCLLVSLVAVFLTDRLGETPGFWRGFLLVLGLGGAGYFGGEWARHWIIHRRGKRALAILVQRRHRKLGDRLLGVVELTDEEKHPANFSPELYRAAIKQVSDEAANYNFAASVSTERLRKLAVLTGFAVVVAAIPFLIVPSAAWSSFQRWAAPWAELPRYTLVRFEWVPKELIVPTGEPFEISIPISYRSFWRPQRATWQFEEQPSLVSQVQSDRVSAKLPSQTQKGILKVKVGDVTARIPVVPTARPALKEMKAVVDLPKYLEQKPVEQTIKNGVLSLLEGSQVNLQALATRALAEAHLQETAGSIESLQIKGPEFFAARTNAAESAHWIFRWKDALGLTNASPWRLAVQTQKDLPPAAEFPDQPREIAMLYTDVIPLKAAARDDYGVRQFGVLWEVSADWQKTNDVARQKFTAQADDSSSRKIEDIFSFSPSLYDIPMDTAVDIRAYAHDYYPEREASESAVYRIYVLGNEKHAEMVRQRLESLLVRLEEVTRLEEKIANTTRDLEAKPNPAEKQINETRDQQNQNANDLNQMAQEGVRTLREALRNPAFPEDTVRDWAKTLQTMQDLASGSMKEAAESLKSAAASQKSSKENLQKALSKEEEALQKLQAMQKRVNQGLDQLQALTLAQRLRKVGSREKELQGALQKNISESIGLLPQELPPSLRQLNTSIGDQQGELQKETLGLQAEISRFHERTQKTNYAMVSKQMTEAKTDEELEKIKGQIQQNIAMESMQKLDLWAGRFEGWADLLEPKSRNSQGSGSGSGSGSDNATKQLMALLRMRESQMNLREQTKLLDKEKPANYNEKAKTLKRTQDELENGLAAMQKDNKLKFLDKPLEEADASMQKVAGLLGEPVTDKVTDQAHVRTVDLLTDAINLINEQAQRTSSSSQEPGNEEMNMLMQMMALGSKGQGMQVGANAGGSMAGGSTSDPAKPGTGDMRGRAGENRRVNKGAGATGVVPTEFKQALEGYFKALENN